MMFLATGARVASTTERTMQWSQRVLYHIRNMIVATIGVKEVAEELSRGIASEKAKRMFKEIGHKVECMFLAREREDKAHALSFEILNSCSLAED